MPMPGSANMSDPAAARLLEAAIALLRAEILPHLGDDAARIRADHLTRLLRWSAARVSVREGGLRQLAAALGGPSTAAPEAARAEAEAAFSAALPQLLQRLSQGDAQARAELRAMVAAEKSFYLALDPDISGGSQVVYRGGRIDNAPPPAPAPGPVLDEAGLTAYLRRRLGRADVSAGELRAIPGGFSKFTLFFTLHDSQAPAPRQLVLRQDMKFRFLGKTVTDEFGLLGKLHQAGLPVAAPLWLEEDASLFGGAFIVSARVAGDANVARWAADAGHAGRACRELAAAAGRLHGFAPSALGYPAEADTVSAGACLEQDIANWTARFHRLRQENLPLLELPLAWLARNIPPALYQRPARVVHGDFGFHNLMVGQAGEVTAVLDWEFAGLSDPTQDVRFLRMFIAPLMDWDEFLAIYLAHGGIAPCPETDFFFDLWQQARNTIGCVEGQALFDTGMTDDVKFALAGHVFSPYLCVEQSERLLAHLGIAT